MEKYINYDLEYNRLAETVINTGFWKYHERTGKKCLTSYGHMLKFDLSDGRFPALTTKKLLMKPMIAELLGFIRAVDNAATFRELGCNFWDANANLSKHWVENPNRKGTDDLGRIYGVQARDWKHSPSIKREALGYEWDETIEFKHCDQLQIVVDKLKQNKDDRRLIVSHWNPGELNQMALPPCHLLYQFGLRTDIYGTSYLDMCLYQRSADIPLGVPMNIASYALMLQLISKITGHKPGVFTHFIWDAHIYEDQLDLLKEQITRTPFDAPTLVIDTRIESLEDLETWCTTDNFKLLNYQHHPHIKFPFSE
jgi:thymidylate synthase